MKKTITPSLISIGAIVERGGKSDLDFDWHAIHPALADKEEWSGATINTGAVELGKFLALAAAAERTAESDRGAELVAYAFPGAGMRWTYLSKAMFTVLRAVHGYDGITSAQIDEEHWGIDTRTRISELRAGGFIIAGRRDPDHPRTRRYHLLGELLIGCRHIMASGCRPLSSAMPSEKAMLAAICRRADHVAARTKANAASRLAKLSTRTFLKAPPVQLDMFEASTGEVL